MHNFKMSMKEWEKIHDVYQGGLTNFYLIKTLG
jgi:hypothetical protein